MAFISDSMVPLMIFYIVGFGILAKRPVLDDFIEGAKDGMKTVAGIFPTLVGLMVSVGVLRESGLLEALGEALTAPASWIHLPGPMVPVVLVRMISSSAATGMVLDIFKQYGADSLLGMMASIMMGSTETILYCLSVYFGSIGVTKTRYTAVGGLLAMAAGVAASVWLAVIMTAG